MSDFHARTAADLLRSVARAGELQGHENAAAATAHALLAIQQTFAELYPGCAARAVSRIIDCS